MDKSNMEAEKNLLTHCGSVQYLKLNKCFFIHFEDIFTVTLKARNWESVAIHVAGRKSAPKAPRPVGHKSKITLLQEAKPQK